MTFTIFCGYILDLIFGDPQWFPHPVRIIGKLITLTESILRKIFKSPKGEKTAGIILLIFIVSTTYITTFLIVYAAGLISFKLQIAVNIIMVYLILATRSLDREVRKVYNSLEKEDIEGARKNLSYIVSRETGKLNEQEITRAAVETVAENISDGITAPLFYLFLGGPVLAMTYKAVNTLDSMVGYTSDKYINFGWASARFDDFVNYLPSRLTGFIFIPIAALLSKKNWKKSFIITLRDRYNHKSPNSAHGEAAIAGALDIQIGGTNIYFGQVIEKPTIGDEINPLERKHIIETINLMYVTSIVGLVLYPFICGVFIKIFL